MSNVDHLGTARSALMQIQGNQPTQVTSAGAAYATAHAAVAIAGSLVSIAGTLQQIATALRKGEAA